MILSYCWTISNDNAAIQKHKKSVNSCNNTDTAFVVLLRSLWLIFGYCQQNIFTISGYNNTTHQQSTYLRQTQQSQNKMRSSDDKRCYKIIKSLISLPQFLAI